MSLSKYYQNSEGFHKEKLVQRKAGKDRDSKSFQLHEPSIFQPISLHPRDPQPAKEELIPQTGKHPADNEETADNLQNQQQTTEQQMPMPGISSEAAFIPETFEEPAKEYEPEIDLSQYITITEAQEQIDKAYREGVETGIRNAENDYGSATQAMFNACNQISTLQETLIRNSSADIQELVLAIADRILRFSVAEQDNTIIETIEEALQRSIRSGEFTIYINPDDYDIVAEKTDDLIANISGLENIVLKKDPGIEKGGARLESENCTIDATIASQFATICEEIRKKNQ